MHVKLFLVLRILFALPPLVLASGVKIANRGCNIPRPSDLSSVTQEAASSNTATQSIPESQTSETVVSSTSCSVPTIAAKAPFCWGALTSNHTLTPDPCSGRTYQVYNGFYFSSYDVVYGSTSITSDFDCAQICDQDTNCNAWSFGTFTLYNSEYDEWQDRVQCLLYRNRTVDCYYGSEMSGVNTGVLDAYTHLFASLPVQQLPTNITTKAVCNDTNRMAQEVIAMKEGRSYQVIANCTLPDVRALRSSIACPNIQTCAYNCDVHDGCSYWVLVMFKNRLTPFCSLYAGGNAIDCHYDPILNRDLIGGDANPPTYCGLLDSALSNFQWIGDNDNSHYKQPSDTTTATYGSTIMGESSSASEPTSLPSISAGAPFCYGAFKSDRVLQEGRNYQVYDNIYFNAGSVYTKNNITANETTCAQMCNLIDGCVVWSYGLYTYYDSEEGENISRKTCFLQDNTTADCSSEFDDLHMTTGVLDSYQSLFENFTLQPLLSNVSLKAACNDTSKMAEKIIEMEVARPYQVVTNCDFRLNLLQGGGSIACPEDYICAHYCDMTPGCSYWQWQSYKNNATPRCNLLDPLDTKGVSCNTTLYIPGTSMNPNLNESSCAYLDSELSKFYFMPPYSLGE